MLTQGSFPLLESSCCLGSHTPDRQWSWSLSRWTRATFCQSLLNRLQLWSHCIVQVLVSIRSRQPANSIWLYLYHWWVCTWEACNGSLLASTRGELSQYRGMQVLGLIPQLSSELLPLPHDSVHPSFAQQLQSPPWSFTQPHDTKHSCTICWQCYCSKCQAPCSCCSSSLCSRSGRDPLLPPSPLSKGSHSLRIGGFRAVLKRVSLVLRFLLKCPLVYLSPHLYPFRHSFRHLKHRHRCFQTACFLISLTVSSKVWILNCWLQMIS